MKKVNLLAIMLSALFCCSKENEPALVSKKELLSGTSQRSWYMYAMTPDERCGSAFDDTWTFFSTGEFEYDHGTVLDDQVKRCGDFVNLIGSWEFQNNETRLKVTALQEKNNPSNTFEFLILFGTIHQIDADKFVIKDTDPSTNREYSIEFRRR
jgi:hypothetical protein